MEMGKDEDYPGQIQVSTTPFVSSLNRFDSLMRRFGGKKLLWGKSSDGDGDGDDDDTSIGKLDGKYVPLEVAIQETCSKGSLLDRIASLEDRLLQMCLEIESFRRSCSSSMNTSCGASSSSNNGSKRERMSSYPTFGYKHNPETKQQHPQAPYNQSEFETEAARQQQNIRPSSSIKRQPKLKGNKKDRKTDRKWKKGLSPSWPHLRILGC